MVDIVKLSIHPKQRLTFQQAVALVEETEPALGLIISYDENDEISVYNFGKVSKRDCLWMSEQLRRMSQDDDIA